MCSYHSTSDNTANMAERRAAPEDGNTMVNPLCKHDCTHHHLAPTPAGGTQAQDSSADRRCGDCRTNSEGSGSRVDNVNADRIVIHGASEHNLADVNLELPRNTLTVFAGVSGSGKTTMAMDVICSEGQRRYVEALSPRLRQFVGGAGGRRSVKQIYGLTPTVGVRADNWNPGNRSTVGTLTEIADLMRLMYARAGRQHCHQCGTAVAPVEPGAIVATLMELPAGTKFMILAPVTADYQTPDVLGGMLSDFLARGFTRARVSGRWLDLASSSDVDCDVLLGSQSPGKAAPGGDGMLDCVSGSQDGRRGVELVIDRLVMKPGLEERLYDSVESALRIGKGQMVLHLPAGSPAAPHVRQGHPEDIRLAEFPVCPHCGLRLPELSPGMFSSNTPEGACDQCRGSGFVLNLAEEAAVGGAQSDEWAFDELQQINEDNMADSGDCDGTADTADSGAAGTAGDAGAAGNCQLNPSGREKSPEIPLHWGSGQLPCPDCLGTGLSAPARSVKVLGISSVDFLSLPAGQLCSLLKDKIDSLESHESLLSCGYVQNSVEVSVLRELLAEIGFKLRFLEQVGLSYLTIKRRVNTIATGELQRLRLAAHLGGPLAGLTYLLDDPASGLHYQDVELLVQALKRLRDRGNTVIVVEHDPQVIAAADHVVEFGPGAGKAGGQITYQGDYAGYLTHCHHATQSDQIPHEPKGPIRRRVPGQGGWLVARGVRTHNLKDLDVEIPAGCMVGVCGVSGAGKSALIMETVVPAVKNMDLRQTDKAPIPPDSATQSDVSPWLQWKWHAEEPVATTDRRGGFPFGRVLAVERRAGTRSGRSNPATFIGAYNHIRTLYSKLPESRAFGFGPERFSFNVKGGRCPVCKGEGRVKVAMQYLPDMAVTCAACNGKRFNEATLRVLYRGLDISQVLDLTFDEAVGVFASVPNLAGMLQWPVAAGLGYLRLGQPLNTLSSGEMQRLRLAVELGKGQRSDAPVLYVLDEPTAGLHPVDVERLLMVLDKLVDAGNTVLLAEHDLQTLWHSDWLIELGPGAAENGGTLVASGTPEQIASASCSSPTGVAFRSCGYGS